MTLPIVGYGDPILRKESQPITKDYPELKQLIADMFETMYAADGVGLAAPQVDLPIRVVVIGFRPYDEKTDTYGEVTEQHTLINPEIMEFGEEKDYFNEGCLSVPDIHEDVLRPTTVRVHYWDEDWREHTDDARAKDDVYEAAALLAARLDCALLDRISAFSVGQFLPHRLKRRHRRDSCSDENHKSHQ